MEITVYHQSPIGILKITADKSAVLAISFVEKADKHDENKQPRVLRKCIKQLDEYFAGKRAKFSFSYKYKGSEFQQKVWAGLENIAYGKTISYKDLSLQLGDEKLVRAVGTANGKNPLAIVVPCHRVIGSDGKLVGYAGGLWRKQWLLEHEQKLAGTQQPSLFD